MTILFLPSRAILAFTLLITATTGLAAQDLPPPQNPNALLRELEQFIKGAENHEQRRRLEAISRIQSAAQSPAAALELHLQALAGTKYLDKHQDFLDWKQKNQEVLRQPSYQNAAQLQLRYLLLGLQRSDQHDACVQVNETMDYLKGLQGLHFLEDPFVPPAPMKGFQPIPCPSDKVTKEAADLMGKPLSGYPVVEWLQIKDLIPDKDFNGSAGDYFGILDKNVKAPLKQRNDPRLPSVWDLQITTAMTQANSSKDSQKALNFKTEKLPALIFEKCTDTAAIGQPNRAIGEMMTLIRSYPTSPSLPDWIETVRNLITNPPVPSAIGTNAPASPVTAPSQTNTPAHP